MTGRFLKDQVYTADAMVKHLRDNLLITAIGGSGASAIVINEANGTFLENSESGSYLLGQVNGIAVEELNKEHTVIAVDSIDTARPWMTLVPWPESDALAMVCTGR